MCIGAKKKLVAFHFQNSNLNWLVMGTSGWCWNGGLALAGSSPAAGSKVPNRLLKISPNPPLLPVLLSRSPSSVLSLLGSRAKGSRFCACPPPYQAKKKAAISARRGGVRGGVGGSSREDAGGETNL
jgi:hypothetical protein